PKAFHEVSVDLTALRDSLVAPRIPRGAKLPSERNKQINLRHSLHEGFFNVRPTDMEERLAAVELDREYRPNIDREDFIIPERTTTLDWLGFITEKISTPYEPAQPKIIYNHLPEQRMEMRRKRPCYRDEEDVEFYEKIEDWSDDLTKSSSLKELRPGTKRSRALLNLQYTPLRSILKKIERPPIDWQKSWFKMEEKKIFVDEVSFLKGIDWGATREKETLRKFIRPLYPPKEKMPRINVLDLDAFSPVRKDEKVLEKSRVHPSQRALESSGLQPYRYGQPGIVRKPTTEELTELRQWKKRRIGKKDTYI
ncbi:hypothetical protein PFISCL1PPCAC_28038, partial [Pristionchus fissidentatus]